MFSGCYVGFYGGYLGVMAKLGPLWSRDNCSLVRGFGKVDNPLVGVVHTCMAGAGGWEPRCWVDICCAAGRCGGHGCGRNSGLAGSCSGSPGYTGWHIWLSTQSVSIDVAAIVGPPVEIILVSKMFEI